MAGAVRTGSRIFFMLLIVLVLLFGGAVWFDFLGLISVKELTSPVLSLIGLSKPAKIEDSGLPDLLDNQRLAKQWEALDFRDEELNVKETALLEREAELDRLTDEIAAKEKELEEREKSFNDTQKAYENRNTQLSQIAADFAGMDPKVVVDILENMVDQDIIDIFRVSKQLADTAGEESMVPIWISLMDPVRVADIERKQLKKPEA